MKYILIISVIIFYLQAQDELKKISIADITRSNKFPVAAISSIHWSGDESVLYYRDDLKNKFFKYILDKDSICEWIDVYDFIDFTGYNSKNFENGIWSHDEKYLLFTELVRARDVKSGGNFFLYNLQKERITKLTDTKESQLNVQFSPDDKKLAFVRSDNLFLLDIEQGKEKQLTFDGQKGVRNGHFDWVYEEEFSIIEGWQWSPDCKYIAFWQIDEREVSRYTITEYDSLYLNWDQMFYPKAGSPNAFARIGVINVDSGKLVWMDTGDNRDIYIPRIYWMPDARGLIIFRLNRLQNKMEILLANVFSGETRMIFQETDSRWLEITNDFQIINKGKYFLWTSERDGFRHIYLYSISGQLVRQITRGNWEVREVIAVDQEKEWIYFSATKKSSMENHLYRIDLKDNHLVQLTSRPGWHRIKISPDCNYYIDIYSNFHTRPIIYLCDHSGRDLYILRESISDEHWKDPSLKPEFITIKTKEEIELNGWLLKPADFSGDKKYPLLMLVYGGPGSQKVIDCWHFFNLWHQYLVQNGYIVACIDNRGTGGKGEDFKKCVYKKLGDLEVRDQIEAARYFAQLEYIDGKRIGIWGWSYGGYMSTLCILKGGDIFKTAVAVAPVTSWRFYDTIYTERYMQTPALNPQGYEESAPINYAKDLEGDYLIIHGTSDDNVHFQNTVTMVEKLITHNKQFQIMIYPGRYHSIQNITTDTREHLFTLISNFIFTSL
jgi:dipeptidyl-peptidase-4